MDYAKVGPALLAAFEDYEAGRQDGVAAHARVLRLVTMPDESPKPARAVVFLHCDEGADLSHVERDLGVELNSEGPIRTGIVPFAALDALSEDPAVHRIVAARQLRPRMDVAPGVVHLPAFRSATGLTGKGVLIGIVDTGIDPNHPAFAHRVLRIWDQTLHGSGVPEGRYGAELTGPWLTMSRDTEGHGTHVAGIAAAEDPAGVAPEGALVVVKSDLADAHIADGIRYVLRVALELGLPCVVNLSLGGHWDAHDGTDALSQVVDAVSGPGRIVCAAAGNEGNDAIHARTVLAEGQTATIRCSVPVPPGAEGPRLLAFNGWYDGDDELEVAAASPGGFRTPFQPVITGGPPARRYQLPDARVQVVTPGPDPANGDHQLLVMAQPASGARAVTSGAWRLLLRGRRVKHGVVDVWALDDLGGQVARFTGPEVSDDMKVGSPGAATAAMTVGSYTTKVQWTDIDGHVHHVGLALDDISDFSSEGPRRDGGEKPDLVAPGAIIVSALSADSSPSRALTIDQLHVAEAGTSMSSPFVAGLVALLLQREPALDPEKLRAALRAASAIPGHAPASFDRKWGYGLVDASKL